MSNIKKILRDLLAGQGSAEAIADMTEIPLEVVESVLKYLVATGEVETDLVGNRITVYRLTPRARQTLEDAAAERTLQKGAQASRL